MGLGKRPGGGRDLEEWGGEFMLKMCCMKEYCPIEVLGFLVFYFMFIGRQDLY